MCANVYIVHTIFYTNARRFNAIVGEKDQLEIFKECFPIRRAKLPSITLNRTNLATQWLSNIVLRKTSRMYGMSQKCSFNKA